MRNIPVIFAIITAVTLSSCKKEGQATKEPVSKLQIPTTDLLFKGELDYSNGFSQILGEKVRILVPVRSSNEKKSYRYRITEYNKDGIVLRSGFVISLEEVKKGSNLFVVPISSKGISLSMEKNSFKDQQSGGVIAKLKSGKEGQTAPLGEVVYLYAGCNNLPQVCIDWYWTSFDLNTGNVVGEIYLYTSCYDPCSFNSPGGGGSNSGSCDDVAAQLRSGSVSSNLNISLLNESTTERTYIYSWQFHKNIFGLWYYKSIENGTHQKQSEGGWKWKSLVHQNVSRSGITLGATIECTVNSTNVQMGIYNAGLQLNYTILSTAICKGSPITFSSVNLANSPIWNVNYHPTLQ